MKDRAGLTSEWSATRPILFGLFAILLVIMTFGLWAAYATFEETIVASGRIDFAADPQIVQHPEGGTIAEVFVREGDQVAAGDLLVRFEHSRHAAKLGTIHRRLDEIHARKARLVAERDGLAEIPFPLEILARADGDMLLKKMLADEGALFRARMEITRQELSLISERRGQIEARLLGVRAQQAELLQQLSAVEDALADQRSLWERGLAPKGQSLAIEREQSILRGQIGQSQAEIAFLETEATNSSIAALQISARFQEDAASKIRDLEYAEIELAEREAELSNAIQSLDIRAPIGGVISDALAAVPFGVIQPAQPILSIIPQDGPAIVKATVGAEDYGEISVGQTVNLRFGRTLEHKAVGVVSRISPKMQNDPKSGRLSFDLDVTPVLEDWSVPQNPRITLGAPVQILVNTGQRTVLALMLAPLRPILSRIAGS